MYVLSTSNSLEPSVMHPKSYKQNAAFKCYYECNVKIDNSIIVIKMSKSIVVGISNSPKEDFLCDLPSFHLKIVLRFIILIHPCKNQYL